jgi:hypothetical protein
MTLAPASTHDLIYLEFSSIESPGQKYLSQRVSSVDMKTLDERAVQFLEVASRCWCSDGALQK